MTRISPQWQSQNREWPTYPRPDATKGLYHLFCLNPTMRDTMKSHGFTDKQSDQMEDNIAKQLHQAKKYRK